jgi:hypothetical protein
MENKNGKKKVNKIKKIDLSQSAVLGQVSHFSHLDGTNEDNTDYIDDYLADSINVTALGDIKTPKKKKVKKIIKKKVKKSQLNTINEYKNIKSNKTESEKKENEKQKDKENIEKTKNNDNNYTTVSNVVNKSNEEKNKNNASTALTAIINSEKTKNKKKEIDPKDTLYFDSIIPKITTLKIKNILTLLYFFIKVEKNTKNACTKIAAIYKGYSVRRNFKLNYLTKKILMFRDLCASKIIAHYKGFAIRKLAKPIMNKKEDNYVIYSTLSNNKMLYFKISFMMGVENNVHFIYCKLLNCFIYYLSKKENNLSKSVLEGYFYNEKYKKLTDDMYEKNKDGENVLNFPKILKKHDQNIDRIDKIINEYMKEHRYKKRKRENILDYEERKKKAMDDDMLIRHKKFEKLSKTGRSKSFMRLKGLKGPLTKGILKPSKSFINLRTDNKKIQFGMAKIKKYHLLKK